jgi:glycosyltransferase involved in cell wall biosynthesis
MKSWPKISIVTPSFNQGQFIEDTIQSVLSQNYPNLEYIIIDGGSTDNSVEIIKKYEKHLTYWISEPDRGHAHALNKGFAKSTGEIMAWINSDDKYFPWTFETVAEVFTQFNDIEWLTGHPAFFDIKGRLRKGKGSFKNKYDFLLGNYMWIQQESTFWKKSLWDKSGGQVNEQQELMVDGELWTRFFSYAELWHLNISIGGYRFHNKNRGAINMFQCKNEMTEAIALMRKSINKKDLNILDNLNFKRFYKYEKILKFLPHFLFRRTLNFLKNKQINYVNNNYQNYIDYKIIEAENNSYNKKSVDYLTTWK